MARLPPETFRLPVERMREGYYTDQYFNLTRDLLELEGHRPRVLMQVFQKQAAILGGVDEAIAVLKQCAGRHVDGGWEDGWSELEVRALHEGDEISPRETVMTIEGDYGLFAHLETVYLGCMARRTLVMRNVKAVVEAAHGKPILFFPARHDHWLVQTGDGWAAHVAGAIGVSTDAQASWWGGRGVGTVPHALIAAFGGDTVAAARLFADRYHGETNITVLVDFENDSVRTALEVADALGERLWGVRLDTQRAARRRRAAATSPIPTATAVSRRCWPAACATRSTPPGTGTCGSSSRAASMRRRSRRSRPRARRSTPTASAPRCCAGRTTSRPTWFASTAARWPRPAGRRTRIPAWSSSTRSAGAATAASPPVAGRLDGPGSPRARRAALGK